MRDIEVFKYPLKTKSHEYVAIGMATYMEIAWNLLHSKRTFDSASILLLEGSSRHLVLLIDVGLPKELEVSTVKVVTV